MGAVLRSSLPQRWFNGTVLQNLQIVVQVSLRMAWQCTGQRCCALLWSSFLPQPTFVGDESNHNYLDGSELVKKIEGSCIMFGTERSFNLLNQPNELIFGDGTLNMLQKIITKCIPFTLYQMIYMCLLPISN